MKRLTRGSFINRISGGIPSILKTGANQENPNLDKGIPSGLEAYTGHWGKEQVMHFIRRTLFGATREDFEYFSSLTLQQSLDIMLQAPPDAAPPLNYYNDAVYTDPDVAFAETWVSTMHSDDKGIAASKRRSSLTAWWIGLMINQNRSLSEKMTLFWHNHVPCSYEGTYDARSFYTYLNPLRQNSLGNFKRMMTEITTTAGMLQYLNGNESTATAPNENFSRELQELFTLGKGPDSHYTQDDVLAAARVLTGWTQIKEVGFVTIYKPELHDSGDKHFSSFYGNAVIKGKSGLDGKLEVAELMDLIFAQPEVARHVCRCIYRWFVNSTIDNNVEQLIIKPLAEIFIKSEYEVGPVLRALLGSRHFFDAANIRNQIKNPVDFLIGLCRQFQFRADQASPAQMYEIWLLISSKLENLSMCPGEPPNVAGWPAYYLGPNFYELWINSTTLCVQNYTTDLLVSKEGLKYPGNTISAVFDLLKFTSQLTNPEDPDKLIDESTFYLSAITFDATQRDFLKKMLLSPPEWNNLIHPRRPGDATAEIFSILPGSFFGAPLSTYANNSSPEMQQVQNNYWCEIWNNYTMDPGNPVKKGAVLERLIPYYRYILQRGECQVV